MRLNATRLYLLALLPALVCAGLSAAEASAQDQPYSVAVELHAGTALGVDFQDPEPGVCCFAAGWLMDMQGEINAEGKVLMALPHGFQVSLGYHVSSFDENAVGAISELWQNIYQQDFANGLTRFSDSRATVSYRMRGVSLGMAYELPLRQWPIRISLLGEVRRDHFRGRTRLDGAATNFFAGSELLSGPFSGTSEFTTKAGYSLGAGLGLALPLGRLALVSEALFVTGRAPVENRFFEWSINPTPDGGWVRMSGLPTIIDENKIRYHFFDVRVGMRYTLFN